METEIERCKKIKKISNKAERKRGFKREKIYEKESRGRNGKRKIVKRIQYNIIITVFKLLFNFSDRFACL